MEGQGLTDCKCQKTRAKFVVVLLPKLATRNITGMLTLQDLDNYDIAAGSHCWQFSLKTLFAYAQAYNLEYIFVVPYIFDTSNPDSIHRASKRTNILSSCTLQVVVGVFTLVK